MEYKYEVGDMVLEVTGNNDSFKIDNLPVKIIAKASGVRVSYIVALHPNNKCGWYPDVGSWNFRSKEECDAVIAEYGDVVLCWYILEEDIVTVERLSLKEQLPKLEVTKESSFYDVVRAEMRERIRKEEAQRPVNAAFEFL